MSNKKVTDEDLTIEKVKQFRGLENISDEQADNIAKGLREFSLLAYYYYTDKAQKKKNKSNQTRSP